MAFFNGLVQALSRRSAAQQGGGPCERLVNHNEVTCPQALQHPKTRKGQPMKAAIYSAFAVLMSVTTVPATAQPRNCAPRDVVVEAMPKAGRDA